VGWGENVNSLRSERDPNPHSRMRRLSRLGELLRMHPDHVEEGVVVLEEALRLAKELGTRRELAVVRLRPAIPLQYAERHKVALEQFERANHTIREARLRGLRDFIEQHRGNCLVELGRFEDARRAFEAALRLRTRRRSPDPRLVTPTKRALAALAELEESGLPCSAVLGQFATSARHRGVRGERRPPDD
jgi:tetratricopeptide (TPR) repeat protein